MQHDFKERDAKSKKQYKQTLHLVKCIFCLAKLDTDENLMWTSNQNWNLSLLMQRKPNAFLQHLPLPPTNVCAYIVCMAACSAFKPNVTVLIIQFPLIVTIFKKIEPNSLWTPLLSKLNSISLKLPRPLLIYVNLSSFVFTKKNTNKHTHKYANAYKTVKQHKNNQFIVKLMP